MQLGNVLECLWCASWLQLAPTIIIPTSSHTVITRNKGSMNIIISTHRKRLQGTVGKEVLAGVVHVKSNSVDGYVILEPERRVSEREGEREGRRERGACGVEVGRGRGDKGRKRQERKREGERECVRGERAVKVYYLAQQDKMVKWL